MTFRRDSDPSLLEQSIPGAGQKMQGRDGESKVMNKAQQPQPRIQGERRQSEEQLQFQSLVLDQVNDAVVAINDQQCVIYLNKAAERQYGTQAGHALGRPLEELYEYRWLRPEDEAEAAKALAHTGFWRGENIHVCRDGRALHVESTVSAMKSQAGESAGLLAVIRDITSRKQAEAERADLLESEREARSAAEEALHLHEAVEERLTLLIEASALLLGKSRVEVLQPAILDLSRRLISADAYAIWRVHPPTRSWRIAASAGISEKYLEQSIEDMGEVRVILEKPVIANDVTQSPVLSARQGMYQEEGIRSLLAVPLKIHGENSGTLTFYFRRAHHFSELEVRIAAALANLAGSAISSTELLEEQDRLRSEAILSDSRSAFLARASTVLASSLNYEITLSQVARLVVPDLADWCAVDMAGDEQKIVRLAVAHPDPAMVEWARELNTRYPPDPKQPGGVPHVLRTGKSELYPEITDEMLVAGARDEEHLSILRSLGFASAMIVPLNVRGRTLGAITFVNTESGRHFGRSDLSFAEDLARRAAMAIENARLYHEATEANRLKDEFLATISHELRTPLTSVIGWTRLLLDGQLDKEAAGRALQTIERNARSQAQIVEDVLDVSRIITGKMNLRIVSVDLAKVITAAIETVRPAAEAKQISLESDLALFVGLVPGDPDRLQQVVWNLLSNAIKFTPHVGRVEVSVRRADSYAEIRVSDTGQGIIPEFLPIVFERFRQADSSTTRKHGGLGLGLAIVRHLVELHGGTVQAESRGTGQGATFTVKLPPVHSDLPLEDDHQQRGHSDAPDMPAQTNTSERLDHLKVLVVDDDEDTSEMLRLLLTRQGGEVVTAASAEEALAELERSRYDLLVSDIGMPEADGYDLIRRVRSLPAERGGHIPAVALTAYARPEDRQRALSGGYQMHMVKPVEAAELIDVIARLSRQTGKS